MRNIPKANTPAIYKPVKLGIHKGKKVGDIWVIRQVSGTPYELNGMFMRSSLAEPIYGYVKNYKKWRREYSIFIWTPDDDVKKVEEFLDGIKVEREDILEVMNKIRTFKYIEPVLV